MKVSRKNFIMSSVAAGTGLFAGYGSAADAINKDTGKQTVKFCAFADIHYFPGQYPHDSKDYLARVLERAEKSDCDFVIHLGDFAHRPKHDIDYVNFYNDSKLPTYHTIGNHDDDGNVHEETLEAYRLKCGHYFFDKNGFRFVVADPNYIYDEGKYTHYSKGNYYKVTKPAKIAMMPPEELEWLKDVIESSPYPCIVFSHQSFERERHSVPNYAAVRRIFNDANQAHPGRVRLVINGHHHIDNLRVLDSIIYLDLNSASFYYYSGTHNCYPEEYYRKYSQTRHCIVWNDPLCAVITMDTDGHLKIDGAKSEFFMGVTPAMAKMPLSDAMGRLTFPSIQSVDLHLTYTSSSCPLSLSALS